MFRLLLQASLVFTFPVLALSQVPGNGVEPTVKWEGNSLRVRSANDLYYLPLKTDKYYSAGIGLAYTRHRTKKLGAQRRHHEIGWGFRQDIFTPRNIQNPGLMTDDRPFASYAVVDHTRKVSTEAGWSVTHQFSGGILGKHSGGGRMQNAVHRMVDFAEELSGWQNEVWSDVVINYAGVVEKSWEPVRGITLLGGATGRLGSLFTDLSLGVGTTFTLANRSEDHYARLSFRGEGKWVGYNATLTGGLFVRDDRYRDTIKPERWVRTTRASLEARKGWLGLEGTVNYLSPEFVGGGHHVFVVLGVGVYW